MREWDDGWLPEGELDDHELEPNEKPGSLRVAPGKLPRTVTALASPGGGGRPPSAVQRRAEDGGKPRANDPAVAARGVAGEGQRVPFLSEISAAFGKHDISPVRAHTGEAATAAAGALGARAYASGEDIAFGVTPDLRTAAHESAHVIQQRAGVSLDGGFGQDGDRYEQHADRVAEAVVRGESAEPILDEMTGGGGGGAIQLDPDRDDEVRVGNEDTPRTHVLVGTTHRFAALMHIYESGDFGPGGLAPSTVVGVNGETVEQLYQMYRRGQIASENAPNSFRPEHAASRVESIRQHGWVSNDADAEAAGIAGSGNRDPFTPINVVPIAEGQEAGPNIDVRLSENTSLRDFVVNGARSGRDNRRERLGRQDFLANQVRQTAPGQWESTDGAPLSAEQAGQLRTHLGNDAERTGALRGETLAAYRRYLEDSSNAPLDARAWVAEEGLGSTADEREQGASTAGSDRTRRVRGPEEDDERGFDERNDDGDYAAATRQAGEPEPDPAEVAADERHRDLSGRYRGRDEQPSGGPHEAEFHRRVEAGDYLGAVHLLEPLPAPLAAVATTEELEAADPELHRRIALDDYAGAVQHIHETESDDQLAADERHRQLARRYRSPDDPPQVTGDTEIHPDEEAFHRLVEAGDHAGAVRLLEERHGPLPPLPEVEQSRVDSEFHRRVDANDYAGAVRLLHGSRERTGTWVAEPGAAPIGPPTRYDPRVVNDPVLVEGARRGAIHTDADPTIRSINAGEVRNEDSGRDRMAPTGTNLEAEYSPTASQGDVGPGGQVSVNNRQIDYDESGNPIGTSGRGAGVQVNQRGGELEYSREGRDGRQRSVAVTYNEQRNSENEVVGRDVGVAVTNGGTARRAPITGSITGGYTFDVQPAQERADGSYAVSWTVGLRGGGGSSTNLGRVQGGLSGQVNRSRSGTEVFEGGSREENLRRAEAYRTDFENHAMREYERALSEELGTVDWWMAQPEGTQRSVQTGGSMSPSAGAAIYGMLSIGVGGTIRGSGQAQVTRAGGNSVSVTQQWTVGHDESLSGGSLVGVEGGLTHDMIVRETFVVDMESGRATLTRLLDRDGYIEEGQPGATLRNRTTEESDGTTLGVNVMVLGEIGGRETTGERREQVVGADGEVTEQVTQLGEQGFTGNTVFGDYARGGLRVEAPEGDGDYLILQQSHASDDGESAAMLARASGDGRAGSRARSSGNWTLSETLSQADARRFHENLLERFGEEGPPLGSPVRGVWGELRNVGLDDRAGRARVICAYLADQGRTGLMALRDISGTRGSPRYARLYTTDGEDLMDGPNGDRIHTFLGQSRSQDIEQWIAAHQEGEVAPADVQQAEVRAAELTARIDRIADVDNFTDMPPEMRQDILGRYRNYRSQLQSIIRRAGSEVASTMSEDGQEHHAEIEALREQVERARSRADQVRQQVRRFRQEWGQESSERRASGQMPASYDSRFRTMWSEAETQFQGAEDAREAAEDRLGAGLRDEGERGEHRQRAAYRSAQADLERARSWYGESREQMVRLANSYRRFERAADEAEAAERGGAESARADSPPREREPTGAAREPTEEREPEQVRTMRFVLPTRQLGRDMRASGMPNMEPYSLANGLVIEALGPGACQRYSEEFEAQHAEGHETWAIRMRVVTPAAGYDRLETTASGWDGRTAQFTIDNAAGESFAQTAVTPRPSIVIDS